MTKNLVVLFEILAVLAISSFAQDVGSATIVRDNKSAQMLAGKHKLSLQWISWDHFGTAAVTIGKCKGLERLQRGANRCYRLQGRQKGRGNGDYLKLAGLITSIDAKQFTMKGEIETRISHINNGKPCTRSGPLTFKITGKRKYWRLMEMDNPCDQATDYVDIYFR